MTDTAPTANVSTSQPVETPPLLRLLANVREHEDALAKGHLPVAVPQGMLPDDIERFLRDGAPAGYDVTLLNDAEFTAFTMALSDRNQNKREE